jgi:hypothetical protein
VMHWSNTIFGEPLLNHSDFDGILLCHLFCKA